jgi:hypothetical protein
MYRLEVEGEIHDVVEWSFHGMRAHYDRGHTVLVGLVRDQAELHGLLQRVADLGLTLVSVSEVDGGSQD